MKTKFFISIVLVALLFTNCEKDSESDLKAPVPEVVKYTTNIKPIMDAKCISCHNTGSTNGVFTTYLQTKNAFTNILDRIQKNNGDPLLMPQNSPKLSQADINLFIKWQTDGLLDNN